MTNQSGPADRTRFVRSWLAISLVLGLLLFTGFALALGDTNTRNLLAGALTASAGTAIAHYFSSKAAAEARDLVPQQPQKPERPLQ